MKVAVRVRPMSEGEQFEGCKECVRCPDNDLYGSGSGGGDSLDNGFAGDGATTANGGNGGGGGGPANSTQELVLGAGANKKTFTFDFVCGSKVSQGQVFQRCVVPLLDRFIEGYNGTILAYGQTGSGKTFTMGTATDSSAPSTSSPHHHQHHHHSHHSLSSEQAQTRGIVPRAAEWIFETMRALEAKAQRLGYQRPVFEVRASFLELYNEELLDLLSKDRGQNVGMKDCIEGGVSLVGLTEEQVTTPSELLSCLAKGAANRTTAATDMNKTSSRSHGTHPLVSTLDRLLNPFFFFFFFFLCVCVCVCVCVCLSAIFTITLKQKLPVSLKAGEGTKNSGALEKRHALCIYYFLPLALF